MIRVGLREARVRLSLGLISFHCTLVFLFTGCLFDGFKVGSSQKETSSTARPSPSPKLSPILSPTPSPGPSNQPSITPSPAISPGVDQTLFPAGSPWTTDVTSAPLDSRSNTVINWLSNNGGWGNGNNFDIDFGLTILKADASATNFNIQPAGDYYSDCDPVSAVPQIPLPATGAQEANSSYTTSCTGDCHLIVIDPIKRFLYEGFSVTSVNVTNKTVTTSCMIRWELDRMYPSNGRGDGCTSADAAGFPIAPLLFTAEEIDFGEIKHAIRFALPNPRMQSSAYVPPASHCGGPTGPAGAPIYGMRFRLKASFDVNARLSNPAARIVAKALQKYGMFLADGGQIALMGATDRFSTTKYSKWTGFYERSLRGIQVSDFEVVQTGTAANYCYNCVKNSFVPK